MKNFTIDEYRQIIRFYKKPMPQTIHRIRNKAKILLCNMLETNLNDHNKILYKLKSKHRKHINKTLKTKMNEVLGSYKGTALLRCDIS
jgi:hypothetical protein